MIIHMSVVFCGRGGPGANFLAASVFSCCVYGYFSMGAIAGSVTSRYMLSDNYYD